MCGRYTITGDVDRYGDYFQVEEVTTPRLSPRYNVAPTDAVYAVAEYGGRRLLGRARWGLLPFWAGDKGKARINARAETMASKPAFRESFRKRRCIIPADGFFEWEQLPEGKLPHYISRRDGLPMGFAGIWSPWRDPTEGRRITTCAIVTGKPNELVRALHDRMPVILPAELWDVWLDPHHEDPDRLIGLLPVFPEEEMREHPVSTLVNSVTNDLPELIAPLPRPA